MKFQSTIAAGLITASALVASISPAIGQANLKPVSPGPGFEHVWSWCSGPKPRTMFCAPGKPGQHWMWIKVLPKRVASRGSYQTEITYPNWKRNPGFERTKHITTVNCDTWEDYDDGVWKPITPGTNADSNAQKACR
jgi:hypothetical protein